MKIFIRKLSFCAGILYFFLSGTSFSQTFLNPSSFTSLGTFNSTGNITIDMSTGQMSGGASFTGVVSGGVLVFTFASFTLNAGHSITFTSVSDLDEKVAFLSQGDMTISGSINANANNNSPGPGGGKGGGYNASTGIPGSGPGGGTVSENGAGGGGFGGIGGNSGLGATGGTTYNANFSAGISGGSGGGGSKYGTNVPNGGYSGGGGGGGVELGALGTLTINTTAVISTQGANGHSQANSGDDGDGGGSGGGIFIHSFNVTLASGCTINANGGNGGNGGSDVGVGGGGGGGGRVYIAAHTLGTLTNNGASINVSGGSGGTDNSSPGTAGATGTSTITQVTNSALPVELNSFSAVKKGNLVELQWNTATEVNNYGFEVERLQDYKITGLQNWEKIGFVQGSGNSNAVKSYSYTDNSSLASGSYSYRLKQIDNDGQFEYSNAVEILFTAPVEFSLKQNYPNPFNPVTNISYSLAEKSQVSLTVYDVLGREVINLVNKEQESGVYNIQFDAGSLNSGIYFYELKAGKYSEVKKLLLVK